MELHSSPEIPKEFHMPSIFEQRFFELSRDAQILTSVCRGKANDKGLISDNQFSQSEHLLDDRQGALLLMRENCLQESRKYY
jgi:hypothetical protein